MQLTHIAAIAALIGLTLSACSQPPAAQITPPAATASIIPVSFPDAALEPADVTITTIADGLAAPWGVVFLPDGDFLVTEKYGVVKRISADGTAAAIANSPDALAVSQGGLQDIALSPDFATDQTVYVSYSYGEESSNGLAIMKARLIDNSFEDVQTIYKSELRKNTTLHYGGRMVFMPDGKLMVTVGEGSRYREKSQMLDSDYGKILRLNTDGTPAAGNPNLGVTALPQIYTYGHRNPQGMIYDAQSETLWTHEHGPQGGDELNPITAGKNYGWPVATFGIDYNGATISPFTQYEGMENPLLHWTPSIAPSGLTLYRGNLFPKWDGDIFVGSLKFKRIHRIDMEGGKPVAEQIIFDIKERVRDVRTGPDGAIYVLIDDAVNGKLMRITPAG